MYKNLSIALLIIAFGLVAARSTGLPSTPTSPVIIVKRRLVNQTATIPTTTIFTPAQDGVYRLSAYATITTPGPNSQSFWFYDVGWTDDEGPETAGNSNLYYGYGVQPGQFWGSFPSKSGGMVTTIEAKAGTPITYAMNQAGPPDGSVYSLYYVLEQID
jgi:hypothetical protein